MRKVLFIRPDVPVGSPAYERTSAYMEFFLKNNVRVDFIKAPVSLVDFLRVLFYIYKNKHLNLLITMPPFFLNWVFSFLPFLDVVFDIRDGWSHSIANGYGGTVSPRFLKSKFAKVIEWLGIKKAKGVITCTHGLEKYFNGLSGKKCILIMNGCSERDACLVRRITPKKDLMKEDPDVINFICVGKFAEYGQDKAMNVIKKISLNNKNKKCNIDFYGVDFNLNIWIERYVQEMEFSNVCLRFFKRISREDVFVKIMESDVGVVVVRDPEIDYGTKVFDYILCKKPIFNYFDKSNDFLSFFGGWMLSSGKKKELSDCKIFTREEEIKKNAEELLSLF